MWGIPLTQCSRPSSSVVFPCLGDQQHVHWSSTNHLVPLPSPLSLRAAARAGAARLRSGPSSGAAGAPAGGTADDPRVSGDIHRQPGLGQVQVRRLRRHLPAAAQVRERGGVFSGPGETVTHVAVKC